MSGSLSYEVVESKEAPEVVFIWLHGLGADGHDFVPVAQMLASRLSVASRFILPHAHAMPVTINGGAVMPAWYDMLALTLPREVDWSTVERSCQEISELIEAQVASGIAYENIYLAGFSQGGAIALYLGLSYGQALGGILALSTYLLAEEKVQRKDVPVFMAHGTMDGVIALEGGQQSLRKISDAGVKATWRTYKMAHSVCPEEIDDIYQWVESCIARGEAV